MSDSHTAATPMVIRVNVSPAREPKALEPPTPPKAPASPPPLPLWINTKRIKKSPKSNPSRFNVPGTQDQIAIISATIRALCCGHYENAYYRQPATDGKAILALGSLVSPSGRGPE